jgi:hypothetical protein
VFLLFSSLSLFCSNKTLLSSKKIRSDYSLLFQEIEKREEEEEEEEEKEKEKGENRDRNKTINEITFLCASFFLIFSWNKF